MHLGFLKGVDLGTVASFLVNTLSVHADVKLSAPLIILLTKKTFCIQFSFDRGKRRPQRNH